MWYGLAFDDAGHLAVGLMDGRASVFDTRIVGGDRRLRHVRDLDVATPVEVTGVPVYAGVGWAAGEAGTLYLLTDGRLIASSAGEKRKEVDADHPAANTLVVLDGRTGKRLWQWKLTTSARFVVAGGGVVAAATQQAYAPDDPLDYGVTVFDAMRPGAPVEKLCYRYHTAGPVVALAVGPDGKTLAAVEAPVKIRRPDGSHAVVGAYRLHLWQ